MEKLVIPLVEFLWFVWQIFIWFETTDTCVQRDLVVKIEQDNYDSVQVQQFNFSGYSCRRLC